MSRTALVSAHIPVEDFDPNKSLGSVKFWLTYTGVLNLRRTRGPALADFNRALRAKLFEWDSETASWVLLADKSKPHAPVCDLCDGPTMDYPLSYDWNTGEYIKDTSEPMEDYGSYRFLRRNGKLLNPLQLVYGCRDCCEGRGL